MKPTPTFADAHDLFHYDPNTGLLTRKTNITRGRHIGDRWKAGAEAGSLFPTGYRYVSIHSIQYPVHRVIWLMQTCRWPQGHIDHINGVRDDNRWCNLRVVTGQQEQAMNQKRNARNKSGVSGVHWSKRPSRWIAYISKEERRYHLGHFDDYFEAVCARKAAETRLGFHDNHGRDKP